VIARGLIAGSNRFILAVEDEAANIASAVLATGPDQDQVGNRAHSDPPLGAAQHSPVASRAGLEPHDIRSIVGLSQRERYKLLALIMSCSQRYSCSPGRALIACITSPPASVRAPH
jgi:hypothetical protein